MSDKELEEWLEKRWMGRYLNVLTDNEWDDLNAIQACSDEQAKSIINLFEKSGHRLKMRLLLQELRGSSLEVDSSSPAPSDSPKIGNRSQPKHQDDSDSDAEPPASDDDDEDDDEDVAPPLPEPIPDPHPEPELPPVPIPAKAASPAQSAASKFNNNKDKDTSSSSSSNAPATPPWVKKTTSSPPITNKIIERRDSDIDLPPAPTGFVQTNKIKSSPVTETRHIGTHETKPKHESPTFEDAEPSLPPPPGALSNAAADDDGDEDDQGVPPLPDDSDEDSEDDSSADSTPKTSPKVEPKPSPFTSSPAPSFTGNGAKNWGAKPAAVGSGSASPTIPSSQPSALKDRMNAFNNSSNSSSSSTTTTTSTQPQPAFGGLKDRLNALQTSASTPANAPKKASPPAAVPGGVQGRLAALAGKIPVQAPGQSHPLFGKPGRQHQAATEEPEENDSGDVDPDIGDDYEIPPSDTLDEPQKDGWLEKRGNGRHNHEYTQMYVVLKDDCLYWLRQPNDDYPCGMICLTEPGLTTTMLEGDELEITSRTRTYRFRAQDADDLGAWHSKIRVAKMLHTSGAKPKTAATTKSTPHLATQVASKAMGAAFMKQHDESKSYASPKMNTQSGRIQQTNKPRPPYEDEDEDDVAPPPAVEDDDDDDDEQSYNKSVRTPQPQQSTRGIISPKQSPKTNTRQMQNEEPPEYRRYKEMLKQGQLFQKYKRGKGKKRLIWCPLSLDRILWGDEKKKKVKGYMMVCDIKGVAQGCLGAKKPANALTITSTERTLDLEAPDKGQQTDWMNAVEMLIELYRGR